MKSSAFPFASFFSSITLLLILLFSTQAYSETLDALFLKLKNANSEAEARALENQIWQRWFVSGDPAVDELMKVAMQKRNQYDFNGAIAVLNKVIELKPDFPEVWNQRATIHFYQQEYEKSLIDIAKALELEPRHFGSMAGRAVIRLRQSKPALARQNVIEALKIHPFLRERNLFPGLQTEN